MHVLTGWRKVRFPSVSKGSEAKVCGPGKMAEHSTPYIGKEKTSTFRIASQYRVIKNLSMNTYVQYEIRRNSNDQTREYEENAIGISLNVDLL